MKFKKTLLSLVGVITLGVGALSSVGAVGAIQASPTQTPISNLPFTGYANNKIVVLHDSGNDNNAGANSLWNEVSFMRNNYTSAFVSDFVGSGGQWAQLAPVGRVQWGALSTGNQNAYAQIELAHTTNSATFKKDYAQYVYVANLRLKQAGLPLTVDTSAPTGAKTHQWVTTNYWWDYGSHSDPYAYLARFGVTRAMLAHDVATGISSLGGAGGSTNGGATNAGSTGGNTNNNVNTNAGSNGVGGTFTFSTVTNVRTAPSLSATITAQYNAGQSVNYLGSVQAEGYTWLKYINYSGQYRYVAKIGGGSASNSNSGSAVANSGTWVFPSTTNIRSGAGLGYRVIGQYNAGQSVRYVGTVQADGYTWAKYLSYSGQYHYVAMIGASSGSSSVANSGSYTFAHPTNVRTGAGLGYAVTAQYNRGQTVNYNRTVQADGYTWGVYTNYSGQTRYVAFTGRL